MLSLGHKKRPMSRWHRALYRSDMFGYRALYILIVNVLMRGTANVKIPMADLLAEQFAPYSKTKIVAPSGLPIETALNAGDRFYHT